MTAPPTGVSSFPVMITWGLEMLAGRGQGAGLQRTLCLDHVPSLWQDKVDAGVANWKPSSHLTDQERRHRFRRPIRGLGIRNPPGAESNRGFRPPR